MPKPSTNAYIVTGPTSGMGYFTALELAKHGTVILVGRDPKKLAEVQATVAKRGQKAVSVVCELSDVASVRRAAAEIIALKLPIAGLLNNAGIRDTHAAKNAIGWDLSYATNHIGPFVLTEALMPHLPDGANVLFVASATEDPKRQPAVRFGFRGGRYISAEASARGEWKPGGSVKPGFDSYATTKQLAIVTAFEFGRENPRLRINAIEPGLMPTTGLGKDTPPLARLMISILVPLMVPFVKVLSTPKRAARVLAKILSNPSGPTGVYFDEGGHPMSASSREIHDRAFTARAVAETRALLASIS